MQIQSVGTGNLSAANSIFHFNNQAGKNNKNALPNNTLGKAETKLMEELNEQIRLVAENDSLDEKTKKLKIETLKEQIDQIMEIKKQREMEALQQNVQNKKEPDKSKPEEDNEQQGAFSKADYKAMIDISISNEKITVMKQAKVRLAAEQLMLNREIKQDSFRGYVSTFKKNLNSKEKSGLEQLEHDIRMEEIEISKTARAYTKAKNEEAKNRKVSDNNEAEKAKNSNVDGEIKDEINGDTKQADTQSAPSTDTATPTTGENNVADNEPAEASTQSNSSLVPNLV